MNEDAWELVGAPMLLDNNGDAVFIYTPPSIRSRQRSKARDPRHAAKLFKAAEADTSGRWKAFHFTSHDNPYISRDALAEITKDMTRLAYEQEILAEDKDKVIGALWDQEQLDAARVVRHPTLDRIVVAVDPEATSTEQSAETGIIVAGVGLCDCKGKDKIEKHGFVLEDASVKATPQTWAQAAVTAYHKFEADRLIAEDNNGGEMVEYTIRTVNHAPMVKRIHASRGKVARAEPVAAIYEQGKVHHVGRFDTLEDQLTNWVQGDKSPDRLDALVWAFTELLVGTPQEARVMPNIFLP